MSVLFSAMIIGVAVLLALLVAGRMRAALAVAVVLVVCGMLFIGVVLHLTSTLQRANSQRQIMPSTTSTQPAEGRPDLGA